MGDIGSFWETFACINRGAFSYEQSVLYHSVSEPKINSDLFPLSACPDRCLDSELRAKHYLVRLDQHDGRLPIQKFRRSKVPNKSLGRLTKRAKLLC